MRKTLLSLILLLGILPAVGAAPPDEHYTMGQQGRLMFYYPETWVGEIIENEGMIGLANSQEALDSVFEGETPQPGQVAVAIFNDLYLEAEFEVDLATATVEQVATAISQDSPQYTFTVVGESEIEGKTVFRMDGEIAESMALILMVVDTGDGIAGLGLLAPASQIREYELVAQTIAGSLDYLSEAEIGFEPDAPLELTYTSLNEAKLTFQYPMGAVVTEAFGAIVLANQQTALDVDDLQSGEMAIGFFSVSMLVGSTSEIEADMTASELLDMLRSSFAQSESTEVSDVYEMTLGEQTVLRTDLKDTSDNVDVILIALDTDNGAVASLLVTPIGERERYEVLFFSILETIDYVKE